MLFYYFFSFFASRFLLFCPVFSSFSRRLLTDVLCLLQFPSKIMVRWRPTQQCACTALQCWCVNCTVGINLHVQLVILVIKCLWRHFSTIIDHTKVSCFVNNCVIDKHWSQINNSLKMMDKLSYDNLLTYSVCVVYSILLI